MQAASEALRRMDYLACEAHCLEALGAAREQKDWAYYARVLLPLQEARRQRRIIAAEGVIRLGSGYLPTDWHNWPEEYGAGCLVLTHPHTTRIACAMQQEARRQHRYVEVLFADNASPADTWMIRSFAGPEVTCAMPAPPAKWRDQWWRPKSKTIKDSITPADWFLQACERLGDTALAQVDASQGGLAHLETLEQSLAVVTDHEKLHQRLADAARAMRA